MVARMFHRSASELESLGKSGFHVAEDAEKSCAVYLFIYCSDTSYNGMC